MPSMRVNIGKNWQILVEGMEVYLVVILLFILIYDYLYFYQMSDYGSEDYSARI